MAKKDLDTQIREILMKVYMDGVHEGRHSKDKRNYQWVGEPINIISTMIDNIIRITGRVGLGTMTSEEAGRLLEDDILQIEGSIK